VRRTSVQNAPNECSDDDVEGSALKQAMIDLI